MYFEVKSLEETLPFAFDFERIIDDFIFICFFVGNDFLPNLPAFKIREGALDSIYAIYKAFLPSFGDYLTCAGEINFEKVNLLFKQLALIEEDFFRVTQLSLIRDIKRAK